MDIKRLLYLCTLALVFFTLGIVVSNIINEIFPACDFSKRDKYIFIECAVQIVIIYVLYYLFNRRIAQCVEAIFKNMHSSKIDSISRIVIIIAFSTGVYRHLDELNKKTGYLKKKYM